MADPGVNQLWPRLFTPTRLLFTPTQIIFLPALYRSACSVHALCQVYRNKMSCLASSLTKGVVRSTTLGMYGHDDELGAVVGVLPTITGTRVAQSILLGGWDLICGADCHGWRWTSGSGVDSSSYRLSRKNWRFYREARLGPSPSLSHCFRVPSS